MNCIPKLMWYYIHIMCTWSQLVLCNGIQYVVHINILIGTPAYSMSFGYPN